MEASWGWLWSIASSDRTGPLPLGLELTVCLKFRLLTVWWKNIHSYWDNFNPVVCSHLEEFKKWAERQKDTLSPWSRVWERTVSSACAVYIWPLGAAGGPIKCSETGPQIHPYWETSSLIDVKKLPLCPPEYKIQTILSAQCLLDAIMVFNWYMEMGLNRHEHTLSALPVLSCLKASRCNVTLTVLPKTPSQRESVANWKSASNIFSPKGLTHQNNHILPWANHAENIFRGQTKLITRLLSATALHAKTQSRFPRFQQKELCILWFISSAVFYNLWCMFDGSLWDLCNILLCVSLCIVFPLC